MSDPLVSILIPCHNAGAWLAETLDSALGQTWSNTEIIVVDDASEDETRDILQAYSSRLKKVLYSRFGSAAKARNQALRESNGEFVKFLDADDLLNPEAIAIQVECLRKFPGHIAHGEWARFENTTSDVDFTPYRCWRDASPVEWLIEAWTGGQPMQQCGIFLIPRTLINRTGGWDERLSLIDDFEFFARVISTGSGIRFSPGARLYYRSRITNSLSQQRSRSAWESAYLSVTVGISHLLKLDESPRASRAAADCLMETAVAMYPFAPDLVRKLEADILRMGGSTVRANGGRAFKIARALFGWKIARRLQVFTRGH